MGRVLSSAKQEVVQVNLVFLFFVLFVFGQIPKLFFNVHFIDLVVLTSAIVYMINVRRLNIDRVVGFDFLLVAVFSLFLSAGYFGLGTIFLGFLYFMRFVGYIVFSYVIYDLVRVRRLERALLYCSLVAVGVSLAILGWLQYLFLPDLRALYLLGWDDHLGRLVSVFLDPAFAGIMLVLALLLVLNSVLASLTRLGLGLSIFLFVSVLFTYSRASYIALGAGVFVLLYFYKKLKYFAFFLGLLLMLLLVLPRGPGAGVRLERVHSAVFKIENYKDSLKIIEKYPLFGAGFNNVCAAKSKLGIKTGLNSCSGLDNGFLFVFATTGVVGGVVFVKFLLGIYKATERGFFGNSLIASGLAVVVHAMFTNTMFYIFVLGWFAVLVAISVHTKEKAPQ